MAITTTCPGCTAIFRLPEELAGKSVRCQKCERMFVVPLPTVGGGGSMPMEPALPEPVIDASAPERVEPIEEEAIPIEPTVEAKPIEMPTANPEPPQLGAGSTPSRVEPILACGGAGLFALAMLATGGFAAIWVAMHLTPPPRVMLVPPLKSSGFEQMVLRDRKDFLDGRKDGFPREKLVGLQPTMLFFDGNNQLQRADRLWTPQPGVDNGRFGHNGPFRLYRLTLERNRRYNFYVKAEGFNPQLKIFRGDVQIVGGFGVDQRVLVSFTPNESEEYTLWITSFPQQEGVIELQVALEKAEAPRVVDLKNQASTSFFDSLRVSNARDPIWNPTHGPYHEYRLQLQANTAYAFKINEKFAASKYQPVLQTLENGIWQNHYADGITRRLTFPYRTREARELRFRVSAANYGEGPYALTVERVGPVDATKQLKRYLVQMDGQGQYEETHTMEASDPLEPTMAVRGPYREYIVTLTKGQRYQIEMKTSRFQPVLSLLDNQGTVLTQKLGGGTAMVMFMPQQTATYRIRATAARPSDRGAYSIKIASAP